MPSELSGLAGPAISGESIRNSCDASFVTVNSRIGSSRLRKIAIRVQWQLHGRRRRMQLAIVRPLHAASLPLLSSVSSPLVATSSAPCQGYQRPTTPRVVVTSRCTLRFSSSFLIIEAGGRRREGKRKHVTPVCQTVTSRCTSSTTGQKILARTLLLRIDRRDARSRGGRDLLAKFAGSSFCKRQFDARYVTGQWFVKRFGCNLGAQQIVEPLWTDLGDNN